MKDANHLSDEKFEWILSQHRENQLELDRIFDEQLSRQKFVLEEKLNRRRMLLQISVSMLRKLQKINALSDFRKARISKTMTY